MDDPAMPFNPHTTIGVCLIRVLISFMLFGVMTTQTYIYYKRFPDDSLKLKALVAFVWYDPVHNIDPTERVRVNRTCDGAHTLCVGHLLYVYTIYDNAHTEGILGRPAPKSYETSVFFYGVIGAIVQGFFSFRIYAFSKKLYLPTLIDVLAFLRLLSTIASLYVGLQMTSLSEYLEQEVWRATASWAIGTTNDLMITSTLVVLLHRRRKDALKRTAALVDQVILWTLGPSSNLRLRVFPAYSRTETGMLMSVTGVISLACFVTMRENFIWFAVFIIEAHIFSNSLLASLNSRETLRAINDQEIALSPIRATHSTIVYNGEPAKMAGVNGDVV
ncbi:hypothetical protein MVEN_01382600 [Mycena venus]|uniref:DUF6534 domain-containing protein n=1 Tax=Mycena venus TaxID=2733690 RepID=A0A8H6XUX4_9AGAR|nr:hypothetical protein MVEN_01382600 [Mycena venus]